MTFSNMNAARIARPAIRAAATSAPQSLLPGMLSLAAAGLLTTVLLAPAPALAGDCGDGDDNGNFNSYACGNAAKTVGGQSTALGFGAYTGASSDDRPGDSNLDTAVGYNSNAFGQSLAVGALARAGEDNQIAPNRYHTAIGSGAEAGLGTNGLELSTAVGYLAQANNSYATVIGANSTANFIGSAAIGAGVQTSRDNQVSLGNVNNSYTLAGINSDASKGAQSGTKYLVTSDASGNLATSTFNVATLENLPQQVQALNGAVTGLQNTVANHGNQIQGLNQTTQGLTTTVGIQGNQIQSLNQATQIIAGAVVLQGDRITQTEQKNIEQDETLAAHDTRITSNTNRVAAVETTTATHTTQITSLFSLTAEHTGRILDLDARTTSNTNAIAALDNRVTGLQADMNSGFNRLDGRIDQAFEGAAMAMAMAGAGLPADKNYAVSLNWGGFEGENAFAGTAQARLSENFILHGGLGVGASQGTVGGRAGMTLAW